MSGGAQLSSGASLSAECGTGTTCCRDSRQTTDAWNWQTLFRISTVTAEKEIGSFTVYDMFDDIYIKRGNGIRSLHMVK